MRPHPARWQSVALPRFWHPCVAWARWVLVSVGLGGAWVSNLQVLEPFRPAFIAAALIAETALDTVPKYGKRVNAVLLNPKGNNE